MVNKKGWIRVMEAMTAILIIAGVVLIAINYNERQKQDMPSKAYNFEASLIREIELNDTLRQYIVSSPPVENSSLPVEVWAKIAQRTPGNFECAAKICLPDTSCLMSEISGEVYVQSVIISSATTYNPKLFRIFCWEK